MKWWDIVTDQLACESASVTLQMRRQNGVLTDLGKLWIKDLKGVLIDNSVTNGCVFIDEDNSVTGLQIAKYDLENGHRIESYTAEKDHFRLVDA